jgi:hypothetical protein
MVVKLIAVLMLLTILSSLAMGFVYLVKDKGQSDRTVKALTVRIGLSVALFALFLIGAATGVITPHGAFPN